MLLSHVTVHTYLACGDAALVVAVPAATFCTFCSYRDLSSNLKAWQGAHQTSLTLLLLLLLLLLSASPRSYRDLSSNLKTYSTLNQLPPELKDEMQEHLRLKFNHQEASDDQVG
jgi:hypothetical protein